jgi:hypothetical protein
MAAPQGLKAANKQDTVLPFLDGMVEFLHRSAADENRTSEVLKACVGLLGDLGQTFGSKMQQLYQMPFVPMLLQQAQQQGDDDIQEVAQWTQSVSTACFVRCSPCSGLLSRGLLWLVLSHIWFLCTALTDGRLCPARQINWPRPLPPQ